MRPEGPEPWSLSIMTYSSGSSRRKISGPAADAGVERATRRKRARHALDLMTVLLHRSFFPRMFPRFTSVPVSTIQRRTNSAGSGMERSAGKQIAVPAHEASASARATWQGPDRPRTRARRLFTANRHVGLEPRRRRNGISSRPPESPWIVGTKGHVRFRRERFRQRQMNWAPAMPQRSAPARFRKHDPDTSTLVQYHLHDRPRLYGYQISFVAVPRSIP